jgi:heterodisulfide reductase subunit A
VEKVRIGVFVCHCGNNIGGVVRVPEVVEYARTLPDVAYAEDSMYSCSEEGLSSLKERIAEHDLNRVIVASCTPRTHEPLFKHACEEAGLNKYLFEFVNIREHCSWIHMHAPDEATEKAKNLVRMGVAKARYLEPQEEFQSDVHPATLVIGGGAAGMKAALNLANQGFAVHLVEREAELGGLLRGVNKVFPTYEDASEFLAPLIAQVENHPRITTYLRSEVESVEGFIGHFQVRVTRSAQQCRENRRAGFHTCQGAEFEVGTVIVATGAQEFKPQGYYGYPMLPNVVTPLELEEMLKKGFELPQNVVMIHCVGARITERPYCGRFCCTAALKNAVLIKEQDPRAKVYILQRDVMAYGEHIERHYRRAMELGVRFIRYGLDRLPEIIGVRQAREVKVFHQLIGKELTLPADLVVLVTPLVPQPDSEQLSKMLKVPRGSEGFFLEAHLKLRPIEFATDGVYLCGSARYPSNITESVSQAYAASAKAAIPMRQGFVQVEAITAFSDERLCTGCGTCVLVCPFSAIELRAGEDGQKSWVNATQCKGCGSCVAACPNGAMQQRGFTDQQVLSMVEALVS